MMPLLPADRCRAEDLCRGRGSDIVRTIFLSKAHLKGAQDGSCKKLLDFFDRKKDILSHYA